MERLSKLRRALIPSDPLQTLFLLGVVLISFSRQLGWYSRPLILKFAQNASAWHRFQIFMNFAVLPTVFAGCAGYFVCFWPGKHPLRKTLLSVVLPALVGLVFVFYNYTSLVAPSVSVLYGGKSFLSDAATMARDWKLFPTAFYACLLGTVLILLFLGSLLRSKAVLPISFSAASDTGELRPELDSRISILIFAMLAVVFFVGDVSNVLEARFLPRGPNPISSAVFELSGALQALFLIVVALSIAGSARLNSLRRVLGFPTLRFLGWTCVIGAVIGFLVQTMHYLSQRAHWAAFDYGKVGPPEFSHLVWSDTGLTAIGLIIVAICEEIVVRGLIQPQLLRRFGMHRGIIFTAAVWGAYEFHLHSFARYAIPDLLVGVGIFFGTHVVLSYLYAWAYLKSGSIVPTIVLHTILNLSTLFRIELDFPGARFVRPAVWAIGTLFLFRFWPVRQQITPEIETSHPDPSPAA